ncbi:MAG: translational GTPase TypA [Clostridium sp.]|nr:translational GTPase TypA [Clostridium sp.]
MKTKREDVRNIAIIAHVDHGKTTLVDQLLKQSGVFRANQEVQERVMDSNDIERERGITILSKNTAVYYKDTKINIIDTPGHADFGGEVERVLKMVNGVVLVVDAYEGPMPQTKFVLQKALELDLSVIVCINKIDRPEARPAEVIDETLELMMDLDASDEQLDCPFIYASARAGFARYELDDTNNDMEPLFETIVKHIPAPKGDPEAPTQVLISTIDYNEFVGRIGVGKIDNGSLKVNQECVLVNHHDPDKFKKIKIGKLYEFDGLKRVEVQKAEIGSIVAISGIADIHIGDTICSPENPEAIPFQKISEPTIAMYFMVNDSPLAGQEGKFITSRHLRDRLFRELNTDVSLRVEETDSADCFKVSGRGELHLSVLIENMRREGYEFAVSKAEVLYKYDERNRRLEPMELAYIDVPEEYTGVVIQKLTSRKGALQGMSQAAGGYSRLEFSIPSRGLIGYRGDFMTDTKGNGILNTIFDGYAEYKGDIAYRQTGSLIAFEAGESITYGLFNAQERGTLFIGPGVKVYSGMVIGQSPKAEDVEINVCKTKKLTNTRSSSADEALKLTPPKIMSLEQCLDFIDTDELLEVTPESLRIRKKILDPTLRKRASFKNK